MRILRSRRSGQSAVMVSLLTMILVMMIAFTTNLGKLVTERIAMQNTADLAAYSGAATQAGVLNEIRAENQAIWETHLRVRKLYEPSEYSPVYLLPVNRCPPCAYGPNMCPGNIVVPQAEAVYTANLAIITPKVALIVQKMGQMGTRARGAAQSSASQNYPGMKLDFLGTSLAPPPLKNDTLDWDYKGWALTIPSLPACPPGPSGAMLATQHTAPSWFFRDPNVRGEVMFAVRGSGTPTSAFLGTNSGSYLGNYFGDRRPLMAYAAALPIAGKVGTIQNGQYRTAKENQWRGASTQFISSSNPRDVDVSSVVEPSQVIGKDYHDYKARYVGFFETEASFARGPSLTQSAGGDGPKLAH